MPELSELFGSEKLSYEELLEKAGACGIELGDVSALRQRHESELRSVRIGHALERELDRCGARNRALVSKLLDLDALTVDPEGVHGLAEQLDALRGSDPYLFDAAIPASDPHMSTGAAPAPAQIRLRSGLPHTVDPVDPDAMSDRDYYKQIRRI